MITKLFKKSPKQPDPALMELAQSNPVLYMMQLDREEKARSKRLRWILISSIIMLYILVLFISTGHPRAALQRATQGFGNLFEEKPYASMVKITGQITPDGPASFASLLPSLEGAFADANAKAVVIQINSPGGSAVQSMMIHDRVIALKSKYGKPVYAVAEDSMTSGAYLIALAADEIYANSSSLVGSIGVVASSFGFIDLMDKVGVERRLYTSGQSKGMLDPFSPESPESRKQMLSTLSNVHTNFISAVIQNRAGKLNPSEEQIFDGRFWDGQTAMKLGLVDGLSDYQSLLLNKHEVERVRLYQSQQPFLQNLLGLGVQSFKDQVSINTFGLSMLPPQSTPTIQAQ